MSRYFYYLIAVNMVIHIVTVVPNILFEAKTDGAVLSIAFALIAGIVITYGLASVFTRFPGKGYPELLKEFVPKWVSFPLLLLTSLIWFTAGLITLVTYSFLLKRFLTPEMPLIMIVSLLLLFISFGIIMKSKSVLYTVEIILLLNIPFIIFIFAKMYTGEGMVWDFAKEAMMYVGQPPDYSAFAAATFTFLGSANLVIFNRLFTSKQKMTWKQAIALGVIGGGILFTSYFIPIGFQGFNNIDSLVHPWFLTADSIRMKYGFIERVLFIFLNLNLSISFISILVHWHVAVELLKSIIWFERLKWKGYNMTPWLFVAIFWTGSLIVVPYLTEYQNKLYTKYALNVFFPFILFLLLVLFFIKRRAKV